MKKRHIKKVILRIFLVLMGVIVLFTVGTYINHRIESGKEISLLKERGYYNPVSVGEYSLNVAKFGNENGEHTIVGMAGLGSGDFSVSMRQMTACLEEDNLIVFVDRAGYGFSDDTDKEMTLEYIVEDYRKALKNAGMEGPYILMPHSIGGAYANYWVSNYPEEIEAVVFVDGSQLSETAFEDEPIQKVGVGDRLFAGLAKIGMSRYVLREFFYHYPDNYSKEEQYLADALTYMTLDSIAPVSEAGLLAENGRKAFDGIITNDVPKLYICASWGLKSREDIREYHEFVNRQIDINGLNKEKWPTEYDAETTKEILGNYEKARQDIIYPYAEKMGNCQVICLAGDHMIYEQKPVECGRIVKEFIDKLQ